MKNPWWFVPCPKLLYSFESEKEKVKSSIIQDDMGKALPMLIGPSSLSYQEEMVSGITGELDEQMSEEKKIASLKREEAIRHGKIRYKYFIWDA